MRQLIKDLAKDWRAVLAQAVVTTVIFMAVIFAVAYGLGGPQRDQRVDEATHEILQSIRDGKASRQSEHEVFLCLLAMTPKAPGHWTLRQESFCERHADGTWKQFVR